MMRARFSRDKKIILLGKIKTSATRVSTSLLAASDSFDL